MNEYSSISKQLQDQRGMMAARQLTLREQLESQLISAQENVSRLTEALSILDEEPRVARLMELLGRSY